MKRIIFAGAATLAATACAAEETISAASTGQTRPKTETVDDKSRGESINVAKLPPDPVARALIDPGRSEEAKARDAGRQPGAVLRLAQVRPGQTVVDIASSNDYYAPIISNILGDDGALIMVEPKRLEEFFKEGLDAAAAYANASDDDNIVSTRVNLDELSFDRPVDRVLNILYYHDTVWTGVDRVKMNQAIYAALKPGGYYLVIDHAARAGAGDAVTSELHRIDPAVVEQEVPRAGFTLVTKAGFLANPDDPKTANVFAEGMRGATDRFVYLFQKPE